MVMERMLVMLVPGILCESSQKSRPLDSREKAHHPDKSVIVLMEAPGVGGGEGFPGPEGRGWAGKPSLLDQGALFRTLTAPLAQPLSVPLFTSNTF